MPKLPQVNIRLAPEHHDLIRELAQRLRANPSLAVGLADFLAQASESDPDQVSPLAHGLADELSKLKDRLAALEEREPRMSRIEAVEARMAALEERPAHQPLATPRPATGGNRDIPMDIVEEAARLWDGGNGLSFPKIKAKKGEEWPWTDKGIARAVRKYRKRTAASAS